MAVNDPWIEESSVLTHVSNVVSAEDREVRTKARMNMLRKGRGTTPPTPALGRSIIPGLPSASCPATPPLHVQIDGLLHLILTPWRNVHPGNLRAALPLHPTRQIFALPKNGFDQEMHLVKSRSEVSEVRELGWWVRAGKTRS